MADAGADLEQPFQRHGAELQEAWRRASSAGGVLVVADPGGGRGAWWVQRLCSELGFPFPPMALADGGGRPWGCLGDLAWELARRIRREHPAALRRYGSLLVSLRPAAAGEEPLQGFRGHAAGVADYLLEGHVAGLRDFFRGRDVSPWLGEDLVSWVLAATRQAGLAEAGLTKAGDGDSQAHRWPLWLDCSAPLSATEQKGLELLAARLGHASAQESARASAGPLPGLLLTVACPSEDLPAELRELSTARGWELWPVPGAEGERAEREEILSGLPLPARRALAAAGLWGQRFRAAELASLLEADEDETERLVQSLAEDRWIVRVGEDRWLAPACLRSADAPMPLEAAEQAELGAKVHRQAAEAAELAADRSRHQRLGGIEGWGLAGLQAMAHGWRVSDYAAALDHGRRAMGDPKVLEKVHPELVLALLCYEAGRFEETDEQFSALLARATKEISRVILSRLQGYAQIFGLHQFERGLETFELPLKYFREQERRREVCFLRNSSAWALLRLGRFDEAQELETRTLEEVEQFDPPDSYLLTLIHLNLGRLLRDRQPQAAADHIAAAREANEGDLSPDLLLIFLLLRAEVARVQGESALRARLWAQAEELLRDFDAAEVAGRLAPLLRRWWDGENADPHRTLGESVRRALAAGLAEAKSALDPETSSAEVPRIGLAEADEELGRLLEHELGAGASDLEGLKLEGLEMNELSELLSELLAEEGSVAWLRGGNRAIDGAATGHGLVLQDPRSASARERVRRALRRAPCAGWVLALPSAGDFFDGWRPLPGELQVVDVKHGERGRLQGLEPVDVRVWTLPEASEDGGGDGRLRAVLERFAELTGVPLLAATALRRAGRWPVEEPRRALRLLLETGMEHLVVGDRWLRWNPQEGDRDPWLALRPKLSTVVLGYASDQEDLGDQEDSSGQQDLGDQEDRPLGFLTAPGCCAQVGNGALDFLERCNGQLSLGQLLADLEPRARREARALLRQLHDRGMVSLL